MNSQEEWDYHDRIRKAYGFIKEVKLYEQKSLLGGRRSGVGITTE